MAELQEEKQKQTQTNGGGGVETKRQRRPSVRLGDIGGRGGGGDLIASCYNDHYPPRQQRRTTKQQPSKKQPLGNCKETLVDSANADDNIATFSNNKSSRNGKISKKNVKKRIAGGGGSGDDEIAEEIEGDLDGVAIGSWKIGGSKSKRGICGNNAKKRSRSNQIPKIDEENQDESVNDEINQNFEEINSEEDDQGEHNDDASPVHLFDNDNDDGGDDDGNANINGDMHDDVLEKSRSRKDLRFQLSDDEMDDPSDSLERNGVKVWLKKLGLERYMPVFEIHEVDDEVLPLLTLEDLKDMGITAVGSRRKMYCSIQKLKKGFS